eukprot:3479388-Rhodomonas_salina.1
MLHDPFQSPSSRSADVVTLVELAGVLFQIEAVETNVPFSDYGGDSLSGVAVISRAAREGMTLSLTSTFEMSVLLVPFHIVLHFPDHVRWTRSG